MSKSRIVRSWGRTLAYLGGGLVLAAISAGLFATIVSGAITFGIALIPAVVALVLVWMAVAGAASAPCPGCGATLDGLSTGLNDGVCCGGCHRFLEGKGGELWLTDPNRIAGEPLFGTRLGESFDWPDGCCQCSTPATRRLPTSINITTGSSSAGNAAVGVLSGGTVVATGGGTRITIEVPHCEQHDNGARLSAPNGLKDVRILFRSYPYLRAFCEKNGSEPV